MAYVKGKEAEAAASRAAAAADFRRCSLGGGDHGGLGLRDGAVRGAYRAYPRVDSPRELKL